MKIVSNLEIRISKFLIMNPSEIKERLRYTWFPFLGRFGKFTPIQEMAIPLILDGENLVLISPAASGKTEAVVAPVVELMIEKKIKEFAILYISPTRALVNDLFRRLEEPFRQLALPLAIKTGDRPVFDPKKMPFGLLTTPESFDSLISRHPEVFKKLKAVVLDELHLLDRTPRGDQLRILLERLRRINSDLSYYALSATIEDVNIGERYFSEAKTAIYKAEREIDYLFLKKEMNFVGDLFKLIRERGLKKILVFFNCRSHAEIYGREFNRPPFRDRVLVHHASLTRPRREAIEYAMNREKAAILCATTTLELGIDIGDIDAIVLFRPPYSVSSLLQRIGRGNRRKENYLFAIGVYLNEWEKMLFEIQFECAKAGLLLEKRYRPSISVLPQQLYSYLYQRRRTGATKKILKEILQPVMEKDEWFDDLFAHLVVEEYIKSTRPPAYFLTSKLERPMVWGKIHSNIQEKSFGFYEVFDAATGTKIGQIFYVFNKIHLAGKTWQVLSVDKKKGSVMAQLLGEEGGVTKLFEGTGYGGNYVFSALMKQRLFPELNYNDFPYFKYYGDACLFHFLSPVYGFILAEALSTGEKDVSDFDGKLFVFRKAEFLNKNFPVPDKSIIREVIGRNLLRLEDNLGTGAYFRHLPKNLQIEDHYQTLDIDGLVEYLSHIRLTEIPAEKGREVIEFIK